MHFLNKELYWQAGWEEISREPEFTDQIFCLSLLIFLNNFDKNIKRLEMNTPVNIFIGKEIPAPKTENLSLICSKINIIIMIL
jgi:transcriptional regulator of heat shock response